MKRLLSLLLIIASASNLLADNPYYVREEIPLPKDEIMELGSIALLPDKKIAVASRRGDVWICEGAYGDDLSKVTWKKFATGLHEPFGMFWREGELFATQRPEITAMRDQDDDGRADIFRTLTQAWGINGDYHEYAFSSDPDKEGNIWTVLCLTGSSGASSLFRGWCLRTTPDGKSIPTAYGIRSPGGIGFNKEGDVFYTDNQGFWNGCSSLKWLKPGSFQGNPSGNKFFNQQSTLKGKPVQPKEKSRIVTERERIPDFVPPAVYFPHGTVGRSPTAVIHDQTEGKFGPFAGQVFVGEQTASEVQRVFLEKVNGFYQGAVFKHLNGFRAGIVPMRLSDDGTLFVGGTNRGWASSGGKRFTFERVRWAGKTPFEILEMRIKKDGFQLTFTQPVDKKTAESLSSFKMAAWNYIYQKGYGSPKVDQTVPTVTAAKLSSDGLTLDLTIKGLIRGNVHHLDAAGLKSRDGKPLLHKDAYYTINEFPAG